jgi:hypothetical protein|tara:strand:- start:920 stop:1102 length:183 start_codon:yes stop_codon:yes gene_type:complete
LFKQLLLLGQALELVAGRQNLKRINKILNFIVKILVKLIFGIPLGIPVTPVNRRFKVTIL